MAEQGGDEKQLADGGETLDGNLESKKLNSFKIATPGVHDHGGAQRSASYGGHGGGGGTRKQPEHVSTSVHSFGSWECFGADENVETLDFGRDTNRLDYFRVSAFDKYEEQGIQGIDSYGGGGGGSSGGGGDGNGGGEAAVGGGSSERAIGSEGVGRGVRFPRWWKKRWQRFTKNR